jgi:hypothetical protein
VRDQRLYSPPCRFSFNALFDEGPTSTAVLPTTLFRVIRVRLSA